MTDIEVVKYSSDRKQEWNSFVGSSKNGTFLFDRDFMEYHADKFIDNSLMFYEGGKLLALFPANIVDDVVYSHQGLSYGGLILSSEIKYQKTILVFKSLLIELYKNNIFTLEIKEIPSIYSVFPSDEILHLLFLCKAELTRRDGLAVVEMQNELMFSKNRKRGVKKGIKSELEVKEVGDFCEFWNEILMPNLKTKYGVGPVHTLEEITLLKNRFPEKIRQFNVYKNGVVIGGTTVFDTLTVAHSQYISMRVNETETGGLDFLYNHILKKIFTGKKYFSFGICNEDQGKKVNIGLQSWKEGFGARMVSQDFYRVKTINYNLLNDVMI